jgi:cation diffusion facilitator family transporter
MAFQSTSSSSACCDQRCRLNYSQKDNEKRTWMVIGLTATTMVVEIIAGLVFGSMALLADGWHMASHAAALSIAALAYYFTRRHSDNPKFSFGTGKIGDLAGYSSALLLAVVALLMGVESMQRLIDPIAIRFNEAIGVAILGLIVNVASAFILRGDHHQHHDHHHTDHNLKAAYLHVLADALTSLLAIAALLTGKYLGWIWMDPMMGIIGAVLIGRWSYGLLKDTGTILLDMVADRQLVEKVKDAIKAGGAEEIGDLHIWRVGPGSYCAVVSVSTRRELSAAHFKNILCDFEQLKHVTVEVGATLTH